MSDEAKAEPMPMPMPDGTLVHGGQIRGRSNTHMLARAVRNGWPIKAEHREFVVDQMVEIMKNAESDLSSISAAKVLIAADGINAKLESIDMKEQQGPNQINIAVANNVEAGIDLSKLSVEELLRLKELQEKAGLKQGEGQECRTG